ncbi:MAG: NUDIX hydrolase [Pseudomonadota bacterium]
MTNGVEAEQWLLWTERLRAIAQTGRAYSIDPYDRERYVELDAMAQQMQAALLQTTPGSLGGRFELDGGYPTPKVEVRAGVFEGERILLVREESDGRWALPGGWADQQISPAGNAEKEVREETGLIVEAVRLVALLDHSGHTYRPQRLEHVYRLLFLCERRGGELSTSLETTDARFFALDDLPELSLNRTAPRELELLRTHAADPERRSWFD